MRGGGDWVRGSGQSKEARSEDEVWEPEIRVPGSAASEAGIWGSVLGRPGELEPGPGPGWDLHAAGRAGVRSGAFWFCFFFFFSCGGKRAPNFGLILLEHLCSPQLDRLLSDVPVAFPGPGLTPICIPPSPRCGPAAGSLGLLSASLLRPPQFTSGQICPWDLKAYRA